MIQSIHHIAKSCLRTTLFPYIWKVARTVTLRKPHKPNYSNPTAYRPIDLLICLVKIVEAVIADRFKHHAEVSSIIPPGHYGGRPQRSTEDALTHFTTWTRNQWARGKYVGALFVDVKATFPTVNPCRLADTLRRQGFFPSLILLVSSYLSQRSTTLAFGDFESEPKQLDIGLPQGSLLSVILYILYNSSMLPQAYDFLDTSSLGFTDYVAFITADKSLNTVRRRLQILANRELEWGKKNGAAFDRNKSQWMILTHHKLPANLPRLKLGHIVLEP